MVIVGLGTDILSVERMQKAIEREGERLLARLFTERERSYCSRFKEAARHYAGRFAAKEAIAKASGLGFSEGISWLDIEILNNSQGAPIATLSGMLAQLLGEVSVLLSISHCESYATATAILTQSPKG